MEIIYVVRGYLENLAGSGFPGSTPTPVYETYKNHTEVNSTIENEF